MQLAGTMSWRIGTDEPQSLLLALYVRDVSGLRPLLDREIPPLEPELPFGEAPSATDTIASTQWADWWHQLLEGGGFWPDGKHPPDLSRLTHDTEIQRLFYWPSRHQPPDFVGLSDMPELQVLVRNHFDRARVWMEARHQEFGALSSARRRVPARIGDCPNRRAGVRTHRESFRTRHTRTTRGGGAGMAFVNWARAGHPRSFPRSRRISLLAPTHR